MAVLTTSSRISRRLPKGEYERLCKIYFIEAPEQGLVKIGYTTDVAKRFVSMVTMSPVPLSLLGTLDGGPEKESELHRALEPHRAHGEWFRKGPEVEALIATATTVYGQEFYNKVARRRGAALQAYLGKMKAGDVVRPTRGPTRHPKTHNRYGNPIVRGPTP